MRKQKIRRLRSFSFLNSLSEIAVQLVGESVTDFGSNLIKMVSCATIFTMVNPLILLVVVPFAALNYFISNYFQGKNYEQEQKSYYPQRRIDYFLDTMLDYVAGKEIRVFSATDFLEEKYCDREKEVFQIQRQKQKYSLVDRLIGVGIVVIQLLCLYLLVGREYFNGQVNIGDISLYINLVLVFSGAFSGLFGSFAAVNWQGERLRDFKDYLAIEDKEQELETEPVSEQFGAIVFEHVWFRYEGAEAYTLKDVNLVIRQGDKLAIVGENGSGKTTLIKLLMRFYTPTKGRILVDGKDYFFVSNERFMEMVEENAFLEYAQYAECCYGTPIKGVEDMLGEGYNVLLDIEVQGAFQVKEKRPETLSIFLLPPSFEELERRLVLRGKDSPEKIARRLEIARTECALADRFDYQVVNDDLDTCVNRVLEIIESNK